MNPLIKNRVWPLVIAVALIATNTSIMGGQPDSDEMIFVPPTVAPNAAIRQLNDSLVTPKPTGRNSATGKASVAQPNGQRVSGVPKPANTSKSTRPTRTAAYAAEPERNYVARPPAANARSAASPIVQASSTAVDPGVTTASHLNPQQGLTLDGEDPILINQNRKRSPVNNPLVTTPMIVATRLVCAEPLLGLNGETATERLLQMRATTMDLERENEALRQQNAGLLSRVKEDHDQLAAGVREIQLARKELAAARSDLDHLRSDLQSLRDKVRIAEREYTAVLQSMGPLLQQLLESDDLGALPPNPTE